ncbi:type II secretion system protein GspN [Geothermobacter hydrogeniphilus]|uniref:Type II secretion system protein N n=1 Tax=Geothermobacter hydrogeniphilus TaxID=1969733 RepID=A0A1X0YBR0_9BACT|nr:type II secretion system protein GspN [Geothermobacter hydrogeniphilus]ORJ62539.1 type II secretion system protein GspN [Geothermobacter hydrogeniphilus]
MARFTLPRIGTGDKRQVLLCLLCGLLAALVAFWINLPVSPLADRLVQSAAKQGLHLVIDRPALAFPFGLHAAGVEVRIPNLPHPPIPLRGLTLTPAWTSLFGSNPGLDLETGVMSGKLWATVHRKGDITLRLKGLQLSESLGPRLPLQVVAVIESGQFNGRLPLAGRNSSELELTLNSAALVGLKTFGAAGDRLNLGRIRLKAAGRGATLKITTLEASGGDIEAAGSGSLTLGRTPASSRLNLTLQLKPSAGLDPALRDLLNLLGKPGRDGRYRLRLSGPLNALRTR